MVEDLTKEQLLEYIFLCEPITERGRTMLRDLGLLPVIKPSEFFEKGTRQLFVPSAVSNYKAGGIATKKQEGIEYSYTDIWAFANQRENGETNRETAIKRHFNGTNGTELYVQMGVVGNGKSIDLQYRIWEQKHAIPYRATVIHSEIEPINEGMTSEAILIDVEEVEVAVDGGIEHRYICPATQRPLWLFCTKVFSTLVGYIKFLKQKDPQKLQNAIEQFRQHFFNETQDIYVAIESENKIFCAIEKYSKGEASSAFVFEEILKTMKSGTGGPGKEDNMAEAKEDVEDLLSILCFLMISVGLTDTTKKPLVLHVLIDNIEDYIKYSGTQTWLLNYDVRQIYEIVKNTADTFNVRIARAGLLDSQVIPHTIAMRRTTRTLLDSYCDGDNQARIDKIVDVTGRVSLYEIWKKKWKVVWLSHLEKPCTADVTDYVEFVDDLLRRDIEGIGTSFQDMFARLMSHSLRREAHGIANVFAKIYDLKHSKQEQTQNINFNNFSEVFLQSNSEPRYLLRQAMLQCYYDDLIKSQKPRAKERWKELNLGYITEISNKGEGFLYGIDGKRKSSGTKDRAKAIRYADSGSDDTYRSLLRRILSILSQQTDENDGPIPLYHTMSMYDLMKKLFSRGESIAYCDTPDYEETPDIPDRIIDSLARVLWSSGLPDRSDNWGPFTLFRISDGEHMIESAESLKDLLKAIWKSKAKDREDDSRYGALKCGIRLAEAGAEFLYNGMTAYSFYLALYCNDLPPLPFLKSPELITHVIVKVYKEACSMCEKYENEAEMWLEGSTETTLPAYFLPGRKSYRESIKVSHRDYLSKYRKYIKSYGSLIGIPEGTIAEIDEVITTYIRYYTGLTKEGKRDKESVWRCVKNCF